MTLSPAGRLLVRSALRRPWRTTLIWSALVLLAGSQAGELRRENTLEVFSAPGHPEEQRYREVRKLFPADQSLLIMLRPARPPMSSAENLGELLRFRRRLLATAPSVEVIDVFVAVPGLESAVESAGTLRLDPQAMSLGRSFPPLLTAERAIAVVRARDVAGEFLAAETREAGASLLERDWTLALAGEPENRYWLQRVNDETILISMPILLLVAGLTLWFLFADPRWLVIVVLALLPPVVSALATLAVVGGSFNSVTVVLPILVSTITLGTTLHLLRPLRRIWSREQPPADRVRELLHRVAEERWHPALLAHLTTSIGFGSLVWSPVQTISHLGIASGAAILIALLSTFHFLPALIALLQPRVKARQSAPSPSALEDASRLLSRVSSSARLTAIVVVWIVVLLGAWALVGIPIESNVLSYFPPRHPLPEQARALEAEGFPSGVVEVVFPGVAQEAESSGGWGELSPFFAALESAGGVCWTPQKILEAARKLAGPVGSALSSDRLMSLVRGRFPQIADLCFAPGGHGVRAFCLLPVGGRETWRRQRGQIEEALATLPASRRDEALITGVYPRAVAVQDGLVVTLERSLLVTGGSIALLFLLISRSLTRAVRLLLPNLLPLSAQAILQASFGLPHDIGTILVYGITLSLVVDGTFHIAHELDSRGAVLTTRLAYLETLRHSGIALVWAAVVLAAGFLTLTVSEFRPNSRFAILLASGMLIGAISDLFLLPLFLRPRLARRTGRARR